ncbi:hypothetical protein BTUL_0004g00360 [Botrytis tulipae]|uniref:Uncharacterized protein n=1 Tax=Botrytis tulipae TaxID=87230 RepID=A0A4Z1F6U4_9HELO|nr:hypothetical protein BTUL_0004g00360 [Botrytis tulipae]
MDNLKCSWPRISRALGIDVRCSVTIHGGKCVGSEIIGGGRRGKSKGADEEMRENTCSIALYLYSHLHDGAPESRSC